MIHVDAAMTFYLPLDFGIIFFTPKIYTDKFKYIYRVTGHNFEWKDGNI